MKKIKIFLCCFLAIVISAAACSCASFTPGSSASDELIGGLDIEASNSEFVKLSVTEIASTDQFLHYRVSATVTPSSAVNKKCTWNLDWTGDGLGLVDDYVSMSPESDTSIFLVCKKAFYGNPMTLTVTTVDGGHTASCSVKFVGNPHTLSFVDFDPYFIAYNDYSVDFGNEYISDVAVFNNLGEDISSIFLSNTYFDVLSVSINGTFEAIREFKKSGTDVWESSPDILYLKDHLSVDDLIVEFDSGQFRLLLPTFFDKFGEEISKIEGIYRYTYTQGIEDCYISVEIAKLQNDTDEVFCSSVFNFYLVDSSDPVQSVSLEGDVVF